MANYFFSIRYFSYSYEPLSDEDVLGHALLKMKDELAETERILEQKVKERTEEVVKQKDEIDSQRAKLEELYNDVTDSIRYAKRLQKHPQGKASILYTPVCIPPALGLMSLFLVPGQ